MTRPRMALLVALAALLLGGCPGSLENPERFEGGTGACDAEQLLAQTCGTNAVCHDADAPQGGLDLASPGVASRVIDVMPGLCVMSNVYVSSADPTGGSFLLEKLSPGASCGSQMPPPPETPLTPEQITCLTNWVVEITGGGSTDAGSTDSAMDAAGDAAGDGATP